MILTWDKIEYLNGSIKQFQDPESDSLSFGLDLGIRNESGFFATVLSLHPMVHGVSFESVGLSARITGLLLEHNQTYVARLWCFNRAGLVSSVFSDGVLVDLTPPDTSRSYVWDIVNGDKTRDADFSSDSQVLSVYFGGFFDCESALRKSMIDNEWTDIVVAYDSCVSGVSNFQVAFGSDGQVDNIVPFLPVEGEQQLIERRTGIKYPGMNSSLVLQSGKIYIVTLRVCNRAGHCIDMSSDGILLDSGFPEGTVFDGLDATRDLDYVAATQAQICANWNISGRPDLRFQVALVPISDQWSYLTVTRDADFFSNKGTESFHCFDIHQITEKGYFTIVRCIDYDGDRVRTFKTNGVVVSHPPKVGLIKDGPGLDQQDIDFCGPDTILGCTWSGFEDQGAPILYFTVTIWKDEDPISGPHIAEDFSQGFNFANVSLEDGQGSRYYFKVCAINAIGQSGCGASDGVLADFSPPIPGRVVNGPLLSQHVKFQSRVTISATWYGFADPQSHIRYCSWAIGSSPGLEDIMQDRILGRMAWASASDLVLAHSQLFYVRVKCINYAGLSSTAVSDGVTVHLELPKVEAISIQTPCFFGLQGQQECYTSNSKSVNISWKENQTILSLPKSTRFAIGTTRASHDIHSFENALSGLSSLSVLSDGTYFLNFFAIDELGRTGIGPTQILIVDSTPPEQGKVFCNAYIPAASNLAVSWTDFNDIESGITHYDLCLGFKEGDDILWPCTIAGLAKTATFNGPFSDGFFIVSVRATNKAGLEIYSSAKVIVDSSPPIPAALVVEARSLQQISDGQPLTTELDISCQLSQDSVHVGWTSFYDPESAIALYEVAVLPYSASTAEEAQFQYAGLSTSITLNCSLEFGMKYKAVVRGWNRAGKFSMAFSNGVVVVRDEVIVHSVVDLGRDVSSDGVVSRRGIVKFYVPYEFSTLSFVQVCLGTCFGCKNIASWTTIGPESHDCYSNSSLGIFGATNLDKCVSQYCSFVLNQLQCAQKAGNHLILNSFLEAESSTSDRNASVLVTLRFSWNVIDLNQTLQQSVVPEWSYFFVRIITCSGASVLTSSVESVSSLNVKIASRKSAEIFQVKDRNGAKLLFSDESSPLYIDMSFLNGDVSVAYEVGIGITKGDDSVRSFIRTGNNQTIEFTGPFPGGKLFATVYSPIDSEITPEIKFILAVAEITIDSSPPIPAALVVEARSLQQISDGQPLTTELDISCQLSQDSVHVGWTSFYDPESAIALYEVAVLPYSASSAEKAQFQYAGLSTSITLNCSLEFGMKYKAVVRGWNRAGISSDVFSSGFWVISSEFTAQIDGSRNSLDFKKNLSFINDFVMRFNFTGGIDSAECGAGTTQYGLQLASMNPCQMAEAVWDTSKRLSSYTTQVSCRCFGQLEDPVLEDLQNGTVAFLTARVYMCTGEVKLVSSNGVALVLAPGFEDLSLSSAELFRTDTTAPIPSTIYIDAGNDRRCLTSLTGFSAFWMPFVDHESNIVQYTYQITETLSQATILGFLSVGNRTSLYAEGLNLSAGIPFKIGIRGFNSAGLFSDAWSANVTPITTGPVIDDIDIFKVSLVDSESSTTITATTQIQLQGGYFSYIECGLGVTRFGRQIARYRIEEQARISVFKSDLNFQILNISCSFPQLSLLDGQEYFATIAADSCGFLSVASSAGIIHDSTPPHIGNLDLIQVKNPSDSIARVTGNETLVLIWHNVLDIDSGVLSQRVLLCSGPKQDFRMDNYSCISMAAPDSTKQDVTVDLSKVTMKHNETYWLVLEVKNHAQLKSHASIPIHVDMTKPVAGIVGDGGGLEDIGCQRLCRTVSVHWKGFWDHESDIIKYEWAVGFQPYASNVLSFTAVDLSAGFAKAFLDSETSAVNNKILYSTVKATNAAGLTSEATSDGVRMLCEEIHGCPFSQETVCI